MKRYIEQLVEDLEEAAKNPPSAAFIEPPPHLENKPEIAELALVPFQTIEELTGIEQESFPNGFNLHTKDCEKVNAAIFKIFESLNIELVDAPENLPPEILYDALTSNWQYPVQFLPTAGMDLELCTGDPLECPYGPFCDCGEDWEEEDHTNLDERFDGVVKDIAKKINAGCTCYLNIETLEIEVINADLEQRNRGCNTHAQTQIAAKNSTHNSWEYYCKITPLSISVMQNTMRFFAFGIKNKQLLTALDNTIENTGNLEQFEAIIKEWSLCKEWLDFKLEGTESHVKKEIWNEINSPSEDFLPE